MSFSFFKARSKTPQEVATAIQESLVALDTKTVVEVRALEKALEEVEKNFSTMRYMLSGDGETEAKTEQVLQLAVEMCKEDVLTLLVHKLPLYGWQARKDLVHCRSILLRQAMDSKYCCLEYIEHHLELLGFLVVWYILESASFQLFFKYVELSNFDVASDAFAPFKDLLTKHEKEVSEYLASHYDKIAATDELNLFYSIPDHDRCMFRIQEGFTTMFECMSNLSSLSFLNLSYNDLQGQIPTGSQHQTLNDPFIYTGNQGLCGDPLPKKCKGGDNQPKLPTSTTSAQDHEEDHEKWFYLVIATGFTTGFRGVVGTLVVKKTWRHAYFKLVEDLFARIYVQAAVTKNKLKEKIANRKSDG